MAEINTQAVIDAITLALRAEYPDALILDEEAMQDITPGAFIVSLLHVGTEHMRGRRYKRTPSFDVIYFADRSRAECVMIADHISLTLGVVATPAGDKVRGINLDARIDDEQQVLHFTIDYPYFFLLPDDTELMEYLKVKEGELYG